MKPLSYKPSALATELSSSKAIAEKDSSLSSWYIASLCLLFLDCGRLLIQEVHSWFYWTHELLVAAEKFTVGMPMIGLELATLRL